VPSSEVEVVPDDHRTGVEAVVELVLRDDLQRGPGPFPPLQPASVPGAERPAPLADGLVGDGDSALRQEILDVSEAQTEPVIQPDGMADDLGWEPVAAVAGCGAIQVLTLPAIGST
jgi:hypothetical protein